MAWRHRLRLDFVQLCIGIEKKDSAIDVVEVDQGLAKLVLECINTTGDLASLALQGRYGVGTLHAPIEASI
ncbi:hypothetical protein C725_2713 [Pacificimonas flava]|uniref:Uncharacterized protein n=1 Tax=Pacificimonas flava TaxID=1234595 RepID=M2T613_9SPHN|nr:hypothetical protein C725_2713 [Pacificimonas flava]